MDTGESGAGERDLRLTGCRAAARIVAALVSTALLVGAGYLWYTYRSIDIGVTRLGVHLGAPPGGATDIDGEDQNILLVGNDDRSTMTDAAVRLLKVGRDGGSQSTDTMMIAHIPADGAKATLISLPRDAYVRIPGHGKNKLNAAYVFGYNGAHGSADQRRAAGADLLIKTVQNLTGLTINHYVQVSLIGFYDIAKAIGGIEVNLCDGVDDTVAHNGGHGGSGFRMAAGKHTLIAVQALEFVRQRYNFPDGLGDLDRVRRQQYFLTAAFRKLAGLGLLFKLHSLGDALERDVYMDADLDLIELAQQMENLQADHIAGTTIPYEGFDNDSPVGDVEIIKPVRVRAFVDRLINGAPAHATARHPRRASATRTTGPLDRHCIE